MCVQVVVLTKIIRVGLTEKMRLKQRVKGGEGVGQGDICRKNI